MPKYTVIVTRDITESAVFQIEAPDAERAEDLALERQRAMGTDTRWEIDDGSWDHSSPYVTDVTKVE